ncbi:hypothetical protein [Streptomyces antibioticus]|uniref:hypothetical protein n=1 Tax=Streptomyces antibioticus TaxID=1890 RepID=UPI00225AF3FB|nr:hypothetical protein [Streptomyces antibioticus]MCX4739337.1 hypothetical protein [Streptomyces antibioticus]
MRPTARLLTGGALAVVAVAAGGLAAPSHAADTGVAELEVRPVGVVPGERVSVRTTACGPDGKAAGDAGAVGAGRFTLAPEAPGAAGASGASGAPGGTAGGGFRVPPSAYPGTYEIVARCSDGGRRLTGDLVVTLASARRSAHPHGSVKTGVGGAVGRDPVQTAAGVAALAVAAAGGTWLLHRRARGDGI